MKGCRCSPPMCLLYCLARASRASHDPTNPLTISGLGLPTALVVVYSGDNIKEAMGPFPALQPSLQSWFAVNSLTSSWSKRQSEGDHPSLPPSARLTSWFAVNSLTLNRPKREVQGVIPTLPHPPIRFASWFAVNSLTLGKTRVVSWDGKSKSLL